MMVAKATAQRQGICSALVVALDLSFIMLSPLPDSDRARLATCPFGPRPEHPDCALGLEEAPARARGLPASPNLINLRNDNNTSKSHIAGTVLATGGHAAHRTRHQCCPPPSEQDPGIWRPQTKGCGRNGLAQGNRWFARVELAKPRKKSGGCGSTARPPLRTIPDDM